MIDLTGIDYRINEMTKIQQDDDCKYRDRVSASKIIYKLIALRSKVIRGSAK